MLWSLLLILVSTGCASNAKSTDGDSSSPALKPIDQVQLDIAEVKQQLLATVGAAEAGAADLPVTLAATESAIANLRETLAQLDKRSDDYLVMWSRQASVTIHSGGVYRSRSQVPQRTRAKYDQMLNALRDARDQVNPALAELRQITANSANNPQLVARARERVTRGIARLDEASRHLADLKELVRLT
jgi:hypothetical protein